MKKAWADENDNAGYLVNRNIQVIKECLLSMVEMGMVIMRHNTHYNISGVHNIRMEVCMKKKGIGIKIVLVILAVLGILLVCCRLMFRREKSIISSPF